MNLIDSIDKIPDLSNSEFWDNIDNVNVKETLVFLIISKLRALDPEMMADEQIRSAVSELKAFQKMLDFKQAMVVARQGDDSVPEQDEIDDPSFDYDEEDPPVRRNPLLDN